MRSLVIMVLFLMVATTRPEAQVRFNEDFETGDTSHLPLGWTRWQVASHILDTLTTWTVRDTGSELPGIVRLSVARSGVKSVGVSWLSSLDTSGSSSIADVWLVSPRISGIETGDSLVFWGTGSNAPCTSCYLDSIEIWLSVIDSLPASFQLQLGTVVWPEGSTYGLFQRYAFDVGAAAGLDIFVGFRYFGDWTSVAGYFVQLDDIAVLGLLTSAGDGTRTLPEKFALRQNYPNPFNPETRIGFTIPSSEFVELSVYDILGEKITTLVYERLEPGTYERAFDGTDLTSGVYFVRMKAGAFHQTTKAVLMK